MGIKKLENIGSKPTGLLGVLAGKIMNFIHYSHYKKIINNYIISNFDNLGGKKVLDVGCGGGMSVKIFSKIDKIKKVIGLDYSQDMVNLSKKVNKLRIKKGVVEILNGDVLNLPFEDNCFDIITAFDNVNFWPDHQKAISQIISKLKNNGIFFIINAYPKKGTKWYNFVKFKNDQEYKKYLTDNGLKNVKSVVENNTIILWGKK